MNRLLNDIEYFCRLCGGSGFEEEVAQGFITKLREAGVESCVDNLGNVIARIAGESSATSVMLAAHLDEVGLVVQYIEESGFLRFDTNGLIDARVLPACEVRVAARNGPIDGVVGTKPSHLVTEQERRTPVEVSDLWIDVGAEDRAHAERMGIRVGDPVTYRPNFRSENGLMFGKALDNRIGLALLADMARRLSAGRLPFDVYLVATVQEEIGSRGAKTAAEAVNPTIALMVDTVSAIDAVARPPQATAFIGRGPVLRTLDFRAPNQGTVYSRKIREFLIRIAEQHNLPYQLDVFRTWTDATTIHVAREGIATQGLFVPRRYSHSPVEVSHLRDVEVTAELIWNFLASLDEAQLRDLQKRF